MISVSYPKIETLYNRDPKTFSVIDELRMPEFGLIRQWIVTEKIDGTNVRIALHQDGTVEYGGRTDAAQMPVFLMNWLQANMTPEKLQSVFPGDGMKYPEVILFGEGYGEKIQKGGGNYRSGVSVRLFDVIVDKWWLNLDSILDIATRLGLQTVPTLGIIKDLPESDSDLTKIVSNSVVAQEDGGKGLQAEGIVARTLPLLLLRNGQRLMWKLKFSDFKAGKR